jgi:hypothetical protein
VDSGPALRSPGSEAASTPPRFQSAGLSLTSISRGRATMGYSRVGSSLLCRASRPWTLPGYSDAGSTCSPSLGMLATAVDDLLCSVGTHGLQAATRSGS